MSHVLSTSSLRAQRSSPESLCGKTLDCFAALAMTEQGAASSSSNADSTCRHTFASSRRVSPELCFVTPPSCPRGRREGRVPASTRGPLRENGAQGNRTAAYRWCQSLGLPSAMVGRLMPCSPGSRVPAGLPRPNEIHRHRAGRRGCRIRQGLTVATTARTTRFCRTHGPPFRRSFSSPVDGAGNLQTRRSLAAPLVGTKPWAHGEQSALPLATRTRTLPRPPQAPAREHDDHKI